MRKSSSVSLSSAKKRMSSLIASFFCRMNASGSPALAPSEPRTEIR